MRDDIKTICNMSADAACHMIQQATVDIDFMPESKADLHACSAYLVGAFVKFIEFGVDFNDVDDGLGELEDSIPILANSLIKNNRLLSSKIAKTQIVFISSTPSLPYETAKISQFLLESFRGGKPCSALGAAQAFDFVNHLNGRGSSPNYTELKNLLIK